MLLKATAVTPVKPEPVTVTLVPMPPVVGVMLETIGELSTVKLPLDVAVPPAVVTANVPLVVPAATTAVICVGALTVYDAAGVPLKLTAVAPLRFVPVIVTLAPMRPVVGVKLVTVTGSR